MIVRAGALIPDADDANGYDQKISKDQGASICQKTVGLHSLHGYCQVISVNHPVQTRMQGRLEEMEREEVFVKKLIRQRQSE